MTARMGAVVVGLVAALVLLAGCSASDPEPATVRPRTLSLEGEVRNVVDENGIRVAGASEDDRGVLVVLVERREVDEGDRVRVTGEQDTLVVREIEERFDVELADALYGRLEGEQIVVARTLVVLATAER